MRLRLERELEALDPEVVRHEADVDGRTRRLEPRDCRGLLYAYNVDEGGLSIYNPDPPTGTSEPNEPLLTLSSQRGHWNSPVIADGRIALGDGNANQHATTGAFTIWSLAPVQPSGSG